MPSSRSVLVAAFTTIGLVMQRESVLALITATGGMFMVGSVATLDQEDQPKLALALRTTK